MAMKRLLELMAEKKASDIFVSVGAPIAIKINGVTMPINQTTMTAETVQQLLYEVLNERQIKEYEDEMELNTAYNLAGVGTFRISAFRQKGSPAVVVRYIPGSIPALDSLGIPEVLKEVIMGKRGLILMVGATGSGKSTSLSAMLDFRNERKSGHILTLEDPVEFVFHPKLCVIDQREIGSDTHSYVRGLRSALRAMPHIIFVGEMRDRETIDIGLRAAETGNVVVSTMATQSASKTINRIVDIFPVEHQAEIRTRLALSLRAVISQVLLPRIDTPGRVSAREVMFVTSPISNLIREGKIHQIPNVIATQARDGMVLMDDSLIGLLDRGVIDAATALTYAVDPEKMRPSLKRR
jgi:pilus retraction protein PilT